MIKFLKLIFILGIYQAGLTQTQVQLGYTKTCNTDFIDSSFTGRDYNLTITISKKKNTYIYNFTEYYSVSKSGDSSITKNPRTLSSTYIFHKKDTLLEVILNHESNSAEKPITQKYQYEGKVKDILSAKTLLKFKYNNELYPDDELFIYFEPDYGIVKMRNRVWFWLTYYYNSKSQMVTNCDCSKVIHDWKK